MDNINIKQLTNDIQNSLKMWDEAKYLNTPRDYKLADFQYEIIMEEIAEFEKKLDDNHEVALKLTSFGQSMLMYVTNIGYHNPSILFFDGLVNDQPSTLIQHISQLNFLLTSVPKSNPKQPARRIGFHKD